MRELYTEIRRDGTRNTVYVDLPPLPDPDAGSAPAAALPPQQCASYSHPVSVTTSSR